jgi:hypothetical protein
MVASNKTDPKYYAVDIPHNGPEYYGNMWQKVRSIWAFIYNNFYEDYDWFHLGGDDMWVIVENLRYYLDSEEIRKAAEGGHSKMQIPLYLGETFAQEGNLDDLYQTGGPGYTLNKAALKLLVLKGLPEYHPSMWKSNEDLKIGQALRQLGVPPYRTTTDHNSVRYNHFPPGRHFRGSEPHFYKETYTRGLNYTRGEKHSAVYSVSFHYLDPAKMKKVHALLYGFCGTMEGVKRSVDRPQRLRLGRFASESAHPFLSMDIWDELVDNNRTFFVRPPFEDDLEKESGWIEWLDSLPWPVKLVANNNLDWAWPDDRISITPKLLQHDNLERLYVMNPVISHPKVTPLPIGLKWQWSSTDLYGERKEEALKRYRSISYSPEKTKVLFERDRAQTVWVRPATQRRVKTYEATNAALRTPRREICSKLNETAPHSTVCPYDKVPADQYLAELKKHRFVTSPAGKGLDTHATWEALLAGCIPIVPRSTLDPVFRGLPVWLIDSWAEVTDEAVTAKGKEMQAEVEAYDWEKVFAYGWRKEFQS